MKHLMRRKSQEIKDPKILAKLLNDAISCRIGFWDGEEPYIVPLNFGWEGPGDAPIIYVHCALRGRKSALLSAGKRVCFQTDIAPELKKDDKACDWGIAYQSIIGWGIPEDINDAAEKSRILNLITAKYEAGAENVFPGEMLAATSVYKIPLSELTGKRDG